MTDPFSTRFHPFPCGEKPEIFSQISLSQLPLPRLKRQGKVIRRVVEREHDLGVSQTLFTRELDRLETTLESQGASCAGRPLFN
jgi:hypothetical protein